MEVKLASRNEAKVLSEFYIENSDHLRSWEPRRDEGYHTIDSWKKRLEEREIEQAEGRAAYFVSCMPSTNQIVAICSLTNIARGPFLACNMGYAIAEQYQGKGHMEKICGHAINYAFHEIGLNRVMANYMASNDRSAALLKRLGFSIEGMAKRYLLINGKWEDHVLTSLVSPRST